MLTVDEIKEEFGDDVYVIFYKETNELYLLFQDMEINIIREPYLKISIYEPSEEKVNLFYSRYKKIVWKNWNKDPKIPLEKTYYKFFNDNMDDEISLQWKKEFNSGEKNYISVTITLKRLNALINLENPVEFDWYIKLALRVYNLFRKGSKKFPIFIEKDYKTGSIKIHNKEEKRIFFERTIINFLLRRKFPNKLK